MAFFGALNTNALDKAPMQSPWVKHGKGPANLFDIIGGAVGMITPSVPPAAGLPGNNDLLMGLIRGKMLGNG